MKNKNTRGFTVVEIMVVVVIIGLLAGVVAPGIMRALVDARINAAKAQIRQFEQALQMYKMKKSSYPKNLEELTKKDSSGEPFIASIPLDPWGNEYFFKLKGNEYEIMSYGGDGRDGGEGEDADIKISEMNKGNKDKNK